MLVMLMYCGFLTFINCLVKNAFFLKEQLFDVFNYEQYTPVSMFWQGIQYVVITASEIMFSITGLEFSYSQVSVKRWQHVCNLFFWIHIIIYYDFSYFTQLIKISIFYQAPESMKSVVSAAWLLTTALGNLFVVIITENVTFESQVII